MPSEPLKTVAFQGEAGAYSEEAALAMLGNNVHTLPQPRFEDVFQAVLEGRADYGLLPIENSLAGSIHRNYDLLLRFPLHIVGEYHHRVRHCLLALPGVRLEDIQEVHSHPQALAQCEHTLKRMGVRPVPAHDTAGAARWLRETGHAHAAVIASRWAAQVYGLNVLLEHLEDNPRNYTRFILVARDPFCAQSNDEFSCKTSVVFTLPNRPGSLFKALSVFALREINLTKIESRPIPGKPWEYLFYVDFEGHAEYGPGLRALNHLREIAPFVRVLGTYPKHPFSLVSAEETPDTPGPSVPGPA